jgi:hypothetical protein
LAKVYRWTQETAGFDLDDRLTQGRSLQNREIEPLARSFFEGQLDQLKTELEKEQERNRQLVGRIAIIEANAARLGIDPEELYRAVLKPVRSMSRAGSNMNGGHKRFRRS